ncbi:DeoR family transcriptional regulator [Amylibacter marinus]|uniref:DeoR family transcriptional regulator n=1 Tax=Amylibacter marinus TaxID=1475483 RepID=A0ABQ5VXY8_9RHOB|nr:DeoR/GlpR family DNA-binding transcription regulator [Amylibacter marinus]GLQ36301.1 DeoR family transcriptional regulator [Amylibacter marinus]
MNNRQKRIINLLKLQGSVEVDSLSQELQVTTQTIRRDLAELCDQGLATRTHGGARRLAASVSMGYEERRLKNAAGKQQIAQAAAQLIPNGASVILNIGTTTEQVATALTLHEDLTVISNNINIIHILRRARMASLVLIGGTVRTSDGAIVGEEAVRHISDYKTDFAVIGASSIDVDGSILDFDPREVAVARAILENARTRILVIDSAKFDVNAPIRIAKLDNIDFIVTDAPPPQEFQERAHQFGTTILMPPTETPND